jgi:uncharacterized membrane protein
MKDFLQGKWLKHPLHPILVHLPTGLWPAALLFDTLANLGIGGNALVQTSFYAILFGLLSAAAAIPPGLADWVDIRPGKPARKIGIYHMGMNLVIGAMWAANLFLRLDTFATATSVPALPFALSIIATPMLFISGYLGGLMIYDHGINVARHSKKKWRRVAEKGGAAVPQEKGAES